MTRALTVRRAISVAALTAVWCGLWRDLSATNVLVGALIAMALTSPRFSTRGQGWVRPVPAVRLVWLVVVDLVISTVSVAREILTPTDRTNESIVAVTVPRAGRDHMLLLIVAITLTPGTAVVDAEPDTGTLYLHLLHDDRRASTVAHVEKLAGLACEALPTRTTEGAS